MSQSIARFLPDASRFETLDGKNYLRWSQKLLLLFEQFKVDYVLHDKPPTTISSTTHTSTASVASLIVTDKEAKDMKRKYEKDNKLVRGHMLLYMSNNLFDTYYKEPYAKTIWDALKKKYENEDAGKKKYVLGNWMDFHMVDNKPVVDQIHEFESIVAGILGQDMQICETIQAGVLIEKFPPSWADFRNHFKRKKKLLDMLELITYM